MEESKFVSVDVITSETSFLVTEGGGLLAPLGPSVGLHIALGIECQTRSWDLCYCRMRLTTPEDVAWETNPPRPTPYGTEWEAKSLFLPYNISGHIFDLRMDNVPTKFENLSDSERATFEANCLLTEVLDSSVYITQRHLVINNAIYELHCLNPNIRYDIAFYREENRGEQDMPHTFVVRASGFTSRGGHEIPPFLFDIPCTTLMFDRDIITLPAPPVFKRVGPVKWPGNQVRYYPPGQWPNLDENLPNLS